MKNEKKNLSLFLKIIPYLDKYGILILLMLMILALHIMQPDVFLSSISILYNKKIKNVIFMVYSKEIYRKKNNKIFYLI